MALPEYKQKLQEKMDSYVHLVYRATRAFPKEEVYGSTSQLRRAALSVVLNYIEGYARKRPAVQLHFFEIAYGSLKESRYLIEFAKSEGFIPAEEFGIAEALADEIGAMLWTEISALEKNSQS